MATNAYAINSGDAADMTIWEEDLYRETLDDSWFTNLEERNGIAKDGKILSEKDYYNPSSGDINGNNLITIVRNVGKKHNGAKVQIPLMYKLNPKITRNEQQDILGHEQEMEYDMEELELEWKSISCRHKDRMEEIRAAFSVSVQAAKAMRTVAKERRELDYVEALTAAPTLYVYPSAANGIGRTPTAATALLALDSTNTMLTPTFLRYLSVVASTGFNYVNDKTNGIIPPRKLTVNGEEIFILFVPPDVATGLEEDSTWKSMIAEARARGKDNPIFKRGVALHAGILVIPHNSIPIALTGGVGSNEAWGHCVLCGQQTLLRGEGPAPQVSTEIMDHKTKVSYAYKYIQKTQLAKFGTKNFGSFSVYVSRHRISDVAAS